MKVVAINKGHWSIIITDNGKKGLSAVERSIS